MSPGGDPPSEGVEAIAKAREQAKQQAVPIQCLRQQISAAADLQTSPQGEQDQPPFHRPQPFTIEAPTAQQGEDDRAVDQDGGHGRPIESHRESPQRIEDGQQQAITAVVEALLPTQAQPVRAPAQEDRH